MVISLHLWTTWIYFKSATLKDEAIDKYILIRLEKKLILN